VLIDSEGHVALVDFGLAKEEVEEGQMAFSLCGTPEYLAPEVLDRSGHGRSADWWSFGVLIYEMLHGLPPFYDAHRQVMFANIQQMEPQFPESEFGEPHIVDLMKQLLNRDPDARPHVEAIKGHPWFASIDWDALAVREVDPPFVPRSADVEMGRYFDLDSDGGMGSSFPLSRVCSDTVWLMLAGAAPWVPEMQHVMGAGTTSCVQGAATQAGQRGIFPSLPVYIDNKLAKPV